MPCGPSASLSVSSTTLVTIRRHRDKNFPRANINTTSVGFQTWPVSLGHPLPLFPPAERGLRFRLARLSLLFVVGHCCAPMGSGSGQIAQQKSTLWIGISHRHSCTLVFRPGTLFVCCAFTSTTSPSRSGPASSSRISAPDSRPDPEVQPQSGCRYQRRSRLRRGERLSNQDRSPRPAAPTLCAVHERGLSPHVPHTVRERCDSCIHGTNAAEAACTCAGGVIEFSGS